MNKKQDVRDKVKEIKLRQQNWLKQRAEIKDNSEGERTPPSQQISPGPSPAKSYNNTPVSSQKNHASQSLSKSKQTESPAQSLIASKKSKARFQSWLKAKQDHDNSEDNDIPSSDRYREANDNKPYRSDKYSDNVYPDYAYRDHKGSGDVNVLRVPSTRSPGFASPEDGWNSEDETGELTAVNLLSAEDFDTKADDIIAKVKGDMRISKDSYSGNIYSSGHSSYTGNSGHMSNEPDPAVEMSSHVCVTCDKLMIPPNDSPMLLIPCGHTFCNTCCKRSKYCAICQCSVQSSTPNIMLQQIISNYHNKQQQAQRKSVQKAKHNNFIEEYHNLETRQEILREEWSNISKSVEKLTKKLEKDQQQLTNIERKEQKIEREIESLQEELRELSAHKQQYEKNVYELEMNTKQEKNKLILVQDSLRSVEQQMEKVKFLVEDGM